MKTAILIGATGLVGGELLNILLENKVYSKVVVFTRKKTNVSSSRLEQHIINFDEIHKYSEYIKGNDFFCCIGTTLKKSKTKERFIQIDLEYPLTFAEIAKKNGIERFLTVSSIGANPKSGNYYLKTKGLFEERLKELNFNRIFIVRPSFLLGNRKESRWGEKIGGFVFSMLSVFMLGRFRKV